MKLEDGDSVIYQEPGYYKDEKNKELEFININMVVLKVQKVVWNGYRFIDETGNLRELYRVRYILRGGERIENCCYNPSVISRDDENAVVKCSDKQLESSGG